MRAKTAQIPDSVRAIVDRAVLLFEQGRLEGAEVLLNTLPLDTPLRPMVLHLRGLIAMKRGEKDRAQAFLKDAILANPSDAEAHANMGVLMLDLLRHGEATAAFAAALAIDPARADWHFGLAQSLAGAGHPDLAASACRDAVALQPDFIRAAEDQALHLQACDRHDEAIALLEGLLAAHPPRLDLNLLLAASHAAKDDWASAWCVYAAAFQAEDRLASGTPLQGRRLHLAAGDSTPDTLFLARFLPALSAQGATLVVTAPKDLQDLLRPLVADGTIHDPAEPAPEADISAPLAAVAGFLEARPMPAAPHPYLAPDPAAVARWRGRLGSHEGLTIGIASILGGIIDPGFFKPLLDCPRARFFALGADARRAARHEDRLLTLDPAPHALGDWAAFIETLDLVITGDGLLAHLAGALGKPVWIVLPLPADWRWLSRRDDTPWYPQARLFRQSSPGRWEDVVLRLGDALWAEAGAVEIFQGIDRAAAINPVSLALADGLFMTGSRHFNAGNHARAKTDFERALTVAPDHVSTLCNLGALLLRYGWLAEARPLLERAFALAPKLIEARLPLADALFASGETDQAMGHYREALKLAPKSDRAHASIALALAKLGEHETAIKHFETAAKINRNQSAYFFAELAKSLKARGNVEGARLALDHAVKLQPGYIEAHCQLGDLHLAAGRRVEAAASFMRALAVDANHEVAKDGLAKAQRRAAVAAEA